MKLSVIISLAIGLLYLLLIWPSYKKWSTMNRHSKVFGTIKAQVLDVTAAGFGKSVVRYKYAKYIKKKRISVESSFRTKSEEMFEPGDTIDVYFDEALPRSAFTEQELHSAKSKFLVNLVIGIVALIFLPTFAYFFM